MNDPHSPTLVWFQNGDGSALVDLQAIVEVLAADGTNPEALALAQDLRSGAKLTIRPQPARVPFLHSTTAWRTARTKNDG